MFIPLPLLKLAGFALVQVVVIAIFLFYMQDKLLYIPVIPPLERGMNANPTGFRNPTERNLPYEDIEAQTADGIMLRGWKVLQINSRSSPTIVFFHENAGNIGTRLEFIQRAYKTLGVNFIIFAYRGYSNSDGVPTEKGQMLDGTATMDFVFQQKDIDLSQVFVQGRSLGGAVAIYALTTRQYNVRGVIQENTFTNIPQMVDHIFPAVAFLKGLVQRNFWPSDQRIKQMKEDLSVLFISAEKDEIVPPIHMENLFKFCGSKKKEQYMIFGAGHNGSYLQNPDEYFERIREWLKKSLKKNEYNMEKADFINVEM